MQSPALSRSATSLLLWVLTLPSLCDGAVFVGETDAWSYWKGTSEASSPDTTAWRAPAFDDSLWPVGQAPFFYETGAGFGGNTALTDMRGQYTSLFLRKTFRIDTTPPAELGLDVWSDDGCVVWINGVEVLRLNVPDGPIPYFGVSSPPLGEPNVAGIRIPNAQSILVTGQNVIAIQALNASLQDSSDFLIAAALTTESDIEAPVLVARLPEPDSRVRTLSQVEVTFSENVQGVDAADLLINSDPATQLTTLSPRDYLFTFPAPPAGTVQFVWSSTHAITDLATPPNPFAGGSWQVTLDPTAPPPVVRINEFLTINDNGIRDDDGVRSDWIELFNPGVEAVSLAGWMLTDDAGDPTRWRFPEVTLGAGGYLLVWASGENRTNAAAPLHTNFRLSPGGEYLALLDDQTNLMTEFAPVYPLQYPDISFGLDAADPSVQGYFLTPSPLQPNLPGGPGFAPTPTVSLPGAVYTNSTLTVALSAPAGVIRYTTDGTTPNARSAAYTTPLQLTQNTVLQARVFAEGLLPSEVVSHHYVLTEANAAAFSSNLPLLIINTSGRTIPQDARIPAAVMVLDTRRGRAHLTQAPDFQGRAQIEVRGQTSAGFPKRPYNLEINDPYGNDLEVPLYGLPAESDWVLHNPYSDKSLLNNFLTFELHERMGHYAVRRRFVEVFVDQYGGRLRYPDDYAGIYVLLEKIKIDGNRLDLARLTPEHNAEPEISGGYVIKKDKPSPGDRTFVTQGGAGFGAQEFRIHEPKPDEVTPSQLSWIRNYLIQFERALFSPNWLTATGTNHYSHYIDIDSFVDNHWIVEFTKQIDGYRLSNYLHKDRGGKLRMDPIWDWNLSLGNADYLQGEFTYGWYWPQLGADDHLYLRRLLTGSTSSSGTGDVEFLQRIADRWGVLRTNLFAATNLVARIDEIAAYLNEAQVREFQKWPRLGTYVWPNPQFYVTPTTYAGIMAAKKSWVQGRFAWIDAQYPPLPLVGPPVTYITPGFPFALTLAESTLYYTLDGSDPRLPGGGIAPAAYSYNGPQPLQQNTRIRARYRRSASVTGWGGPASAAWITDPAPLRITELMFRPGAVTGASPPPPAGSEFIELANLGSAPLNLAGFAFTSGVSFAFATGTVATLSPGERVVVVRDPAAFAARYGDSIAVAGQFEGALNNAGERLVLSGPFGEVVQSMRFEPDWQPAADGLGFSLVPVEETASVLVDWETAGAWRRSAQSGGSPGTADPPAPVLPTIWINEVLSHTDLPDVDFIELHNPGTSIVDLSGWFLSDDPRALKYRIPVGTRLAPGGFAVFTEADFNAVPDDPASFNLRSAGDEVCLFSADLSGQLTGYRHGFAFGAALGGVAFGREVNSVGQERFVSQTAPSPGAPNPGPRVGPLVISEILYNPPAILTNGAAWNNTEHEYIEIHNPSPQAVPLFDPNVPTNTWRLRDAVRYAFPTNLTLAADEYLLVVPFDPAADPQALENFRARYQLAPAVRLFGPFEGQLDNAGESVELTQPDFVRFYTNDVVTAVLIDRVSYRESHPWPAGADGYGFSLQRREPGLFGDEPAHWTAAAPTPGAPCAVGSEPVIHQFSADQSATVGATVTLGVQASGSAPLSYQWRKNDTNLPAATQPTLTLANLKAADAGRYEVVVFSGDRSVSSPAARLTVEIPPAILTGPQSVTVDLGQPAVFTVIASNASPMTFAWRHNGQFIPGANSPRLDLPAAPPPLPGDYDLVIRSATGSVTSAPAILTLEGFPLIVQPPVPQRAPLGGTATFGVQLSPHALPPFTCTWVKDGVPLTTRVVDSWTDFLTLTTVNAQNAGSYAVRVEHANHPIELSLPASLTLVADSDGDGMPDEFETQYGLSPYDPSDADLDADLDGVSNLGEYQSGTDPARDTSRLRLEGSESGDVLALRFEAAANRTFSVLAGEQLGTDTPRVVASLPAVSAETDPVRTVALIDPSAPPHGALYYWVVTPARPGPPPTPPGGAGSP